MSDEQRPKNFPDCMDSCVALRAVHAKLEHLEAILEQHRTDHREERTRNDAFFTLVEKYMKLHDLDLTPPVGIRT